MKVWKKLAGVVLALAVMMSLTVSAWATDLTVATYSGNGATIDGTSFTFGLTFSGTGYRGSDSRTFTIKDSNGTTLTATDGDVYFSAPQTNDNYTLEPVESGQYAHVATVAIPATQDNSAVNATLRLGFATTLTPVTNTHYAHYKIIDSQGPTTYDLYIYLKSGNDNGKPYAAILAESGYTVGQDETTHKMTGFTETATLAGTGIVTIQKEITGNNAGMSDTFQFEVKVDFADADVAGAEAAGFTYVATKSNSATWGQSGGSSFNGTITYSDSTPTVFTVTLGHNDYVTIPDLPAGTVVSAREIEAAGDDYQVKSAMDTTDTFTVTPTVISTFADSDTSTGSSYNTSVTVSAGDAGKIIFTNNRDVISPTGVVLRFAPYIAMLGAGLTTMVIAPRRKEEE